MRALAVVGLFPALLVSCSATYGPDRYEELQHSTRVYEVRSPEEDFALLRSAELTLENGSRYFVILDTEIEVKPDRYGTHYSEGGGAIIPVETYVYRIELYRSKSSAGDEPFIYDAAFVRRALRVKYGMDSDQP